MNINLLSALYIISGFFMLAYIAINAKIIWLSRFGKGGVGWTFWHEIPLFIWLLPFVLISLGIYYFILAKKNTLQ
jgi:hypothetical protein